MPGVREGSIVGGSVRRRIGPGTGLIAWRDERSEGGRNVRVVSVMVCGICTCYSKDCERCREVLRGKYRMTHNDEQEKVLSELGLRL